MPEGGRGGDVLEGGAGSDAFVAAPGSGHGVVLGFRAARRARGLFDHVAFVDVEAADVTVGDTDRGARIARGVGQDGTEGGSIPLLGVAGGELRQGGFMFGTPRFVAGIDDFGSWHVFA